MTLMKALKRWFERWAKKSERAAPSMRPAAMLTQIAHTEAVEYSCDDVLRLLDEFAEAVLRGDDAARLWPLVQKHLEMCPDCREEFEALMRILRASPLKGESA